MFLASAFLPGAHFPLLQEAQDRPQARFLLSLSSLAQGHLVSTSSQPFFSFQSFLLTATLSVDFLKPLSAQLHSYMLGFCLQKQTGSGFFWTAEVFLVLQTLDVGIPASIKPQNIFSLQLLFLSTTRFVSIEFSVWCLGKDENKALCPCKLQCKACG